MTLPIAQMPIPAPLSDEEAIGSELVEIPPELPADTEEREDGSVDFFEEEDTGPEFGDFNENLAEILDPLYLTAWGTELKEQIDKDVEDRKERDKQYADGLKRTGLGKEAPGGAEFEGASRVVHPMLAKGAVDFASRAIKELFPASGPCKTQIIGEQNEEKLEKAERKKKYMNWQATTQIEENRSEIERLLSQVPLAGAAYKRWWWDKEAKRPRTEAVFIDDVFTPYGNSDFYTSPRVSYRQLIGQEEFEKRIRQGLYRDAPEASEPGFGTMTDKSESREASDKIEGADSSNAMVYNEDGLRTVWQIEIIVTEENDPLSDRPAPYVVHLDDATGCILGYFRNWSEDDDRLRKKHWMSEWPFIPWRGGPAIGLAHLIGSMAAAATGSLRALLDTAHIQNFPGAVRLKGARGAGKSEQVSPTEITELEFPAGVDDIRKVIMPFPFNGPSPVLFQVMEWLSQQAEVVVATASEKIADAGANMPVGTAMALIEHGSTNFSAVHARLHAALKRDLEIQHRLNSENIEDEETIEELGELIVYRSDFVGPMDIIPVSDPNIFSEAQRYAQLQAILQLKGDPQFAPFFKADQLLGRALKLLNVPDIEGIANLPKETKKISPIDENYAVATQERPLKVYATQDHIAHLKAHIQFATSPMLGANPLIASGIMAPLLQHCKEHLLELWREHAKAATEQFKEMAAARGHDLSDEMAELYGSGLADQILAQTLSPMIMPGLEAMQKIVQQIGQASAPGPSPDIVLMESTKKELKGLELASQEKLETARMGAKQNSEAIDAQRAEADRQSQEKLAQLATSVEMIRDQTKAGSTQMLAEFQAKSQENLTVLTKVLEQALGQMQATAGGNKTNVLLPGGMDLATELLTPMLGGLQQTLAESLSMVTGDNSPMSQSIVGLSQQQQEFRELMMQQQEQNQRAFAIIAQSLKQLSSSQGGEVELFTGPDGQRRARRVAPSQQP